MFKMMLSIDGMACSMCESHINDAIRRELNVKKVTSSHSKGETVIIPKAIFRRIKSEALLNRQAISFLESDLNHLRKKRAFFQNYSGNNLYNNIDLSE